MSKSYAGVWRQGKILTQEGDEMPRNEMVSREEVNWYIVWQFRSVVVHELVLAH